MLKQLSVAVLTVLFTVSVYAGNKDIIAPKNVSPAALSIAVDNLTKKLRHDLVTEKLAVKFTDVQQYAVGGSQVNLKGEGFCVLTDENNELPISFDIKVDNASRSVIEVNYDFLQFSEADATSSVTEEILMKELMKKISRDFKTQDVVIAIDGFEKLSETGGLNKFLGAGEVRVGGLEWRKIKFDVVLDAPRRQAERVVYKLN